MSSSSNGTLGIIGAATVAVLCCAAPLLIAAVGAAGVTAWMSESVYLVIPAAIIIAGIGVVWFVHRRGKARDGDRPQIFNKVSK